VFAALAVVAMRTNGDDIVTKKPVVHAFTAYSEIRFMMANKIIGQGPFAILT
jgi:hypothetical protein